VTRVGVVGGGITGLATTHYLAERDVDVVCFEADGQPGGVVRSERVDDRVLEWGPQRIRRTPAVAGLVDDLGLHDEVLEADGDLPLYVYADGELGEVPRSLSAFLLTDLLSSAGKLRVLAEPLTAPIAPGESAADAFRRKFGDQAYRNVIEPLFGGIYGSDPAAMPARHALERLMALEDRSGSLFRAAAARLLGDGDVPPPVSFADGLQTLPGALYRAHEPYVHLDAEVDRIAAGDVGDGFRIRAGDRSVAVDRVVVTVPAPAAASILDGLEDATAAPLSELTYNSLTLVSLEAELAADAFGYQVRRDQPLETLGVTWNDGLFDRDGVYTAFLGGMHDPAVVDRADGALGAVAAEEFEAVTGVPAQVRAVRTLPRALPAYDATWAVLEDVRLPEGVTLATNYTARLGVPSRLREARQVAEDLHESATAPSTLDRSSGP
jgi:oxygen-dependent protoporphyrinogen oxidase